MMHTSAYMEVDVSQPTEVALRPHHDYRSWTSLWYDDQGHRRTKRFGKEGEVTRSQARALFRQWFKSEWEAKPSVRNPDDPNTLTVAKLADAYRVIAQGVYTKNGKPSRHLDQVDAAMDALIEAFGPTPAVEIDHPRIAKLRDAMIRRPDGEVRAMKTVNGRLYCIKAAIKWARERSMVSAQVLYDVLTVAPLRPGRSEAKDPKIIKPVPDAIVERTKEKLPLTVRAMIDVQRLTGMRPGEVCNMRPADIDTKSVKGVWVYTPWTHKTEGKGKTRQVALGPKCQKIIRPFLKATPKLTAYLFTPAAAQAERRAERSKARKTPMSCGNVPGSNIKARPKRSSGTVYTNQSYRKAIRHACRAVEKEMQKTDDALRFPSWHPHQLRHSYATLVRRDFGKEAVADTLGHSSIDMAEVYAERSLDRAAVVARKVG